MSNDNGKFSRDMQRLFKSARRLLQTRLPGIVKVEGLDFIHDNFDRQGFDSGTGVQPWPRRKVPTGIWRRQAKGGKKSQQLRATKTGARYLKDQGRALLVKRGHLRRAWDRDSKASDALVAFRNVMPYAARHNDGLDGMPERQQIGDSRTLDKRIMRKIDQEMQKILNTP